MGNNLQTVADKINILSEFLAKRDIPSLRKEDLKNKYGVEQVDLLILFGASIIHGCRSAAKAFNDGISKQMMIVGGEGHTTDTLRNIIHSKCPEFDIHNKAEADIIAYYLEKEFGIEDCILETKSTNCGNNVSNALQVIEANGLTPRYIIVMQDSSMQLRMDAGFHKMWLHKDVTVINYASYRVKVVVKDNKLCFEDNDIEGLWDMDHYINLQMGEIPRLADNKDGYGPNGKNYIAHVDIPLEAEEAFNFLKDNYTNSIREANDKYK